MNKVDNNQRLVDVPEFYSLGIAEVLYPISSVNGTGTGELLDDLVKSFETEIPTDENIPKLAIIGQPNVGKSSLLNALIGTERAVVTPIAGTTRDTIHSRYNSFGFDFYLIDTAGIRKKRKVKEDVEFYSVMRTIRAVEDCDVCLFLIDATQGITAQDLNIFHMIQTNQKGVVFIFNKWDLVEKDTNSSKFYTEEVRQRLEPFNDVPILFTSVKDKQRIHKALETAVEVYKNRSQKIPTSQLNKHILPILDANPPPATKGKLISLKYITQLPGPLPRFVCFTNHPQYIRDSYYRLSKINCANILT